MQNVGKTRPTLQVLPHFDPKLSGHKLMIDISKESFGRALLGHIIFIRSLTVPENFILLLLSTV